MMTVINGVQYREVARKAEVGEKIKVVSAGLTFGDYGNGDVFTVIDTNFFGGSIGVLADVKKVKNNPSACEVIAHHEYVVLEPVADPDIIVHDGKQYRKVDRPVREGDEYLYITYATGDHFTEGKVYKINSIEGDVPRVTDNDGDNTRITGSKYAILEPVAPDIDTIKSELAATKAKVAEMEAQLAEVKRKAEETAKWAAIGRKVGEFKKGDVVKTLQEVGGHPIGTIGVLAKWEPDHSYLIEANGETYFHTELALVAPVESIVNLRGGDAV